VRIQIAVKDGMVQQARMKVFGGVPAIAAASWFCEWVEGRMVDDARAMDTPTIMRELDLPVECARSVALVLDAAQAALARHGGGGKD